MKQVENLTVEEVRARVLSKEVVIGLSSKMVVDGKDKFGNIQFKPVVERVRVACEADMKPELILPGSSLEQHGEVKVVIGIDARKHYFDAKTGMALGSQLGPKEMKRRQT